MVLDGLLGVPAQTQFGRVQQVRFALLAPLGAVLLLSEPEVDERD